MNGIREFARAKGAAVDYAPLTVPELRIDRAAPRRAARSRGRLDRRTCSPSPRSRISPASKHPLDSIEEAHEQGWDVLLDAAAFVPTNRLDLRTVQPDFVSDLLLQDVRLSDRRRLPARPQHARCRTARPWFAGGTVNFATVQGRMHILAPAKPASRTARSTT